MMETSEISLQTHQIDKPRCLSCRSRGQHDSGLIQPKVCAVAAVRHFRLDRLPSELGYEQRKIRIVSDSFEPFEPVQKTHHYNVHSMF